jgi:hypothetical protein
MFFEGAYPDGARTLRRLSSLPRPFVIEPPLYLEAALEAGQRFSCGLVLIGRALDELPRFLLAFGALAGAGLGKGLGCSRLVEVYEVAPQGERLLYVPGECSLPRERALWGWADAKRLAARICVSGPAGLADHLASSEVTFTFDTPLRLVHEQRVVTTPQPEYLLKAILRRVAALAQFHCDCDLGEQVPDLLERAAEARLAADETRWFDWERYSSRQDARMKLGGFVGRATLSGVPNVLLPWLAAGTWLHAGKAATFGLGRYAISRAARS